MAIDLHAKPRLLAIFVAPSAGAPMRSVMEVEALKHRGLRGDRYGEGHGTWRGSDASHATLIGENDLVLAKNRARSELAGELERGSHRRNLVVAGIASMQLEGKRFRIGTAEFQFHRPRPPCGHLDKLSGAGVRAALGEHSGIGLHVVTGGHLAVGDVVEIIDSP